MAADRMARYRASRVGGAVEFRMASNAELFQSAIESVRGLTFAPRGGSGTPTGAGETRALLWALRIEEEDKIANVDRIIRFRSPSFVE